MKKKILIIDDNNDLRTNVETFLNEIGFITISASCGVEGIKQAQNNNPDLIICDIVMPDIDGYGVFTKLKHFNKTKHTPFIFLTAKSEYSDFRKGMSLGADDYLSKPFSLPVLLSAINIRLEKFNDKSIDQGRDNQSREYLSLDDNIYLPSKNSFFSFRISKIDYISSLGAYSNIYLANGDKITVRKLLKEWEKILPPKDFIRVHRTTIINVHSILKIDKWFNNSLAIHLKNYSEPIIASRRFSVKFKNEMIE